MSWWLTDEAILGQLVFWAVAVVVMCPVPTSGSLVSRAWQRIWR